MAQVDLISDPLIQEFLGVKKSMVDSSKSAYAHTLFRFEQYCFSQGVKPRTATGETVASFLDQYKERKLKTRKSYQKILDVFYKYLVEDEIINKNPMKFVVKPKGNAQRLDKQLIKPQDFKKLVNKCQGLKIRTIISFMYYTGVRSAELIEMKVSDVNLGEDYIYVSFSKTSLGNRRVPIHKDLKKLLMVYLDKRLSLKLDHRYLFFNNHGNKLKYRTLLLFVEQLQRGTDYHFACHDFRRAFVTRVYQSTKDIRLCQKLAGHASIETTERYIMDLDDNLDQLQEVSF